MGVSYIFLYELAPAVPNYCTLLFYLDCSCLVLIVLVGLETFGHCLVSYLLNLRFIGITMRIDYF